MEPAEGAFDDPAVAAEPRAVSAVAVGQQRSDSTLAECLAVSVGAVATVADDTVGPPARSAWASCHGWDAVEQRQQLRDVVVVASGHRPGQRYPARVGQEVVLAA